MKNMDSRSERFISPSMKMADLINSEPDLLSVVNHCGIALGFGEDSVEECCARQGKDPFTFLTICRIFLFDRSSEVDCGKIRIDDVTDYLRGCHDSYKEIWLPQLEKEIASVLSCRPEAQRKVISEFFGKFRDELKIHFEVEEKKIFPSLYEIGKRGRGTMKVFKEEHGNIGENIQDLINLLLKYIPYEKSDPEVILVLSRLYSLKRDLAIHSRIEDYLILPLVRGGKDHE